MINSRSNPVAAYRELTAEAPDCDLARAKILAQLSDDDRLLSVRRP